MLISKLYVLPMGIIRKKHSRSEKQKNNVGFLVFCFSSQFLNPVSVPHSDAVNIASLVLCRVISFYEF